MHDSNPMKLCKKRGSNILRNHVIWTFSQINQQILAVPIYITDAELKIFLDFDYWS